MCGCCCCGVLYHVLSGSKRIIRNFLPSDQEKFLKFLTFWFFILKNTYFWFSRTVQPTKNTQMTINNGQFFMSWLCSLQVYSYTLYTVCIWTFTYNIRFRFKIIDSLKNWRNNVGVGIRNVKNVTNMLNYWQGQLFYNL